MYSASARGHKHTVAQLLEAGADPNYSNSDGDTALSLAVKHDNEETAKILIHEMHVGKRTKWQLRRLSTLLHSNFLGDSENRMMVRNVLEHEMKLEESEPGSELLWAAIELGLLKSKKQYEDIFSTKEPQSTSRQDAWPSSMRTTKKGNVKEGVIHTYRDLVATVNYLIEVKHRSPDDILVVSDWDDVIIKR